MNDGEISAACSHQLDGQNVLQLRADYNGYQITIWADTNPTLAVSQDTWLITELPGRLRIAALDGCTPGLKGPWQLGLDQAAYAAQIARSALQADEPLATCLKTAHEAILDTTIFPVRYRPQTAAVCADLYHDGRVEFALAYDCEVWRRRNSSWQHLLDEDMLTPEARAQFDALLARKHELTLEQFMVEEAQVLGESHVWVRSGVGQLPELRLGEATLDQWDEIVLATDGGLLDESRLDDLDGWLSGLRTYEQTSYEQLGRIKKSDDVTVIRVRRS